MGVDLISALEKTEHLRAGGRSQAEDGELVAPAIQNDAALAAFESEMAGLSRG